MACITEVQTGFLYPGRIQKSRSVTDPENRIRPGSRNLDPSRLQITRAGGSNMKDTRRLQTPVRMKYRRRIQNSGSGSDSEFWIRPGSGFPNLTLKSVSGSDTDFSRVTKCEVFDLTRILPNEIKHPCFRKSLSPFGPLKPIVAHGKLCHFRMHRQPHALKTPLQPPFFVTVLRCRIDPSLTPIAIASTTW